MTMEERDRLIREEGEKKGEHKKLILQVFKKIQKGKPAAVIAEELEEETEVVQPIFEEIQRQGTNCTVDAVYERLYKTDEE